MLIRQRSFLISATLVPLVLAAWGCGSGRYGKPANQSAASNEPKDESFTTEEYIRLGMPPIDQEWSAVNMLRAERVLASLGQKGLRNLPRYKSARSGAVFARITAPQALEQSVPVDMQLLRASDHLAAITDLSMLYVSAVQKNLVGGSEIVELLGAVYRSTATMVELVDQVAPTMSKDDPSYEARMQSLGEMSAGLVDMVAGGLQTLTEHGYRRSDHARLVGYMQETFPVIVPWLTPAGKIQTLTQLEKMQQDPALKDLQPHLRELYSKVKAAVEQPQVP